MASEEKIINNLKNRRKRIIVLGLLLLFLGVGLSYGVITTNRMLNILENYVPNSSKIQIKNPDLFVKKLPGLFEAYAKLSQNMAITSFHVSKMYMNTLVLAVSFGAIISLFIIQIIGNDKDKLIISMWEKINKKEKNV